MPYTCSLCKRQPSIFDSINHLEAHIAYVHFQCLPYQCQQCKRMSEYAGFFPTETAIIKHMELVHGIEGDYELKATFNKEIVEKRVQIRLMLEKSFDNDSVDIPATIENTAILDDPTQQIQTSSDNNITNASKHINQQLLSATESVVTTAGSKQVVASANAISNNNNKHQNIAIATMTEYIVEKNGSSNIVTGNSTAKNGGRSATPTANNKRSATEAFGISSGNNTNWKIPKKSQKKSIDKDHQHQQHISETAAKGGYNDVNIDGLFEEMDQQKQMANNANDELDEGDIGGGVRSQENKNTKPQEKQLQHNHEKKKNRKDDSEKNEEKKGKEKSGQNSKTEKEKRKEEEKTMKERPKTPSIRAPSSTAKVGHPSHVDVAKVDEEHQFRVDLLERVRERDRTLLERITDDIGEKSTENGPAEEDDDFSA